MEAEERRGRGGGFGKRGSRARELRLGGVTELWEGRLFKAGGETKDVLRRSRSVSVAGAGRGVSLVRRRPGVWLVAGTGRWGWGGSLLARYSSVRASAAQSSNSGSGRPGQRGSQAGAGPHLELRQKLWAAVVEARASHATSAREQEANEFCSSWRDPAGDVGKKRPRAQPGAEGESGTLGGYLPCQR